ncbi:MAG TPA: mechanosensitive ion channel domain-containing protein [Blastocatellia bacterium]|nr:mechanosensitive ion channel domain-containing protein [Blastocatellia bacterium]
MAYCFEERALVLMPELCQALVGESVVSRILRYLNHEFTIQSFRFSALSLLMLVVVIVVAVALSRYIRNILTQRILPKFSLDVGIQYALLKIAHYTIIILGVLYALKIGFAVDLTSVAVVLGAMSLGIGFGLQFIAADLLSGFILLFERPVRVGDRIRLKDSLEGRVDAISLRSTVIITNENIGVIVPNSKLLQNELVNYSYGSQTIRLNIPVSVAYGSDIEKVSQALVEAARSVEEVLDSPPPRPHFSGFGDSALNFEIRLWIKEPHRHPQIRSKVYFQIERLFRRYNIEVPFPQVDLRLRSGSLVLNRNGLDVKEGSIPPAAWEENEQATPTAAPDSK